MLTILLRKMLGAKWMVLCLLIGFLMAAGMMSTVPIYMDASLQRVLVKDMEEYQLTTGDFPGRYDISRALPDALPAGDKLSIVEDSRQFAEDRLRNVGMPVVTGKTVVRDNQLFLEGGVDHSRVRAAAMTDFADHISIISGRNYDPDAAALEAVVTEQCLKTLKLTVGGRYTIVPIEGYAEPEPVTIVGTFTAAGENDSYWSEGFSPYNNAVLVDYDRYIDKLVPDGAVTVTEVYGYYALDYHALDMNRIGAVTAAIDADASFFAGKGYDFSMPVQTILEAYSDKAGALSGMLWVLQIPAMIMLGFYLIMVSRLYLEREKNEIAVLKSRGSTSKQIFFIYAAQSGILGVITLVAAPLLGLMLCSLLGVSNGFLEFVNRQGISAKIAPAAVLYALLAVVVFFAAAVLPVIPASRLSIVQYKQSRTKASGMALWEKLGLDIILIAAGLAFWFFWSKKISDEISGGLFVATGEVNPLFFIFATILIFGFGLLFIRVYPYLLQVIYRLGKPFWTPSQYMAVTSVCRGDSGGSGGRSRFLMMFLVLTFSLGLFYANTARAINNNKEDMIRYTNGADILLKEYWLLESSENISEYRETDFSRYQNLTGVETATRVMRHEGASAYARDTKALPGSTTVMAVEPDNFAKTAWFRNDLLPVHWWNYCNALTDFEAGVIISTSLADKSGLTFGDELRLKWGGNEPLPLTVLAIVDYWPGINPNLTEKSGEKTDFAVMNYDYARQNTVLEPYEVWLKMSPGAAAKSEQLYNEISEQRLPIETLLDSEQMIIAAKTEPQLQGLNGAMTLCFIIIMIMTVIGFLIFWILSIKGRTLQFGILRAMGISGKEVIGILAYEQVLISIVSIALAFVIGGVVSDLFVPMFQSMYAVSEQIPPFLVSANSGDYIKIYAIIAVMLAGSFAVLGGIIRGININKALKLGED